MPATLLALLDHLRWADVRARESLQSLPATSPRTEAARALYAHVAAAEHVWLARLQGRAPEHPVWPQLSLGEAATLAAETADALRAHVDALDPDALDEPVAYRTTTGEPHRSTVREIVAHVALHGSYHRGQIALMVREGGGTPLPTDFILWARGASIRRDA
ncbi:DinB family protein [Roseisolibacter agri]|uniref:Diguanylate cyclase n=1 Tax=Roseisolibacter agri TaxID=2014610 RepID=A0AA37V5T9_9BACT|nr:DinB family protein [Roseisolibacter agri]GLC24536.1 diguanylate cyclase [Roseisolibacter agri]